MGGPRKNAANANASSSDSGSANDMATLQAEMNRKLSKLMDDFKNISDELKACRKDNQQLKEKISQQADEIAELRNDINERELHARSWSICVNNITIEPGKETNNREVMLAVYNQLVVPILTGAVERGEISNVPSCDNLNEIAHILPGKGAKKLIIVRFFSRYWRSLLFKYRRDFAPREAATGSGDRPGRMRLPFYEDLTRATFKQLKQIQADSRVTSAWTVSGTVRFKLENNDTIFRVSSIYDTVDDFVE
jgi:hypothetical protein